VGGEICPSCCGTERENTIDCPLDCVFLQEARLHERPVPLTAESLPNADVRLSESFLREHEPLVLWLSFSLCSAMEKERAVDSDAAEALEALIRTYRTLDSGLIYETRSPNPYAVGLQEAIKTAVAEARERLAKQSGLVEQAGAANVLRDKDVLGALVFLQRLELEHRNGRRRGRAFLQMLKGWFPAEKSAALAL
jgi:hypothetical protein